MEIVIATAENHGIYPQKIINVYSYPHSQAHRVIICFGFKKVLGQISKLTIYKEAKVYSDEYLKLLGPYFLNF